MLTTTIIIEFYSEVNRRPAADVVYVLTSSDARFDVQTCFQYEFDYL